MDTSYPAGRYTLIMHDVPPEPGYTLYCTNPKEIGALQGSLESDDQYRLRIIKHVRVTAGGTSEALRFAGLAAAGVRDIRIRQAPYGMGGFEAVIVREKNSVGSVMDRAVEAMNVVRPVGVKMFTRTPVELKFDMDIDIIAPLAATAQAQETLTKRVMVGVSRYINSLLPGSELVYNQLLQMIMDSSEQIKDLAVNRFRIDGAELLRRNYRPSDDQQIVVGEITANMARP